MHLLPVLMHVRQAFCTGTHELTISLDQENVQIKPINRINKGMEWIGCFQNRGTPKMDGL